MPLVIDFLNGWEDILKKTKSYRTMLCRMGGDEILFGFCKSRELRAWLFEEVR